MKKRSWLLWLPVVLLGYLGLLALLAAVEKGHPDASIQSFADALWYSIVTLSTVGYGDLYPVTAAGKVIGVLFVLLSVGTLAFLVGAAVNFFTGQMLPRLQLRLLGRKKWFVFSQMNDASLALARSLKGETPIYNTLQTNKAHPKRSVPLIRLSIKNYSASLTFFFVNTTVEAEAIRIAIRPATEVVSPVATLPGVVFEFVV